MNKAFWGRYLLLVGKRVMVESKDIIGRLQVVRHSSKKGITFAESKVCLGERGQPLWLGPENLK